MSKIELDNVASGYNLEVINTNFQKIEDELNNKVLYRDNPSGEANQMLNNLDMNGRAILNASNVGGGGGGASDASDVAFTPTGSITSTDVQSAIVEVASDVPIPAINFPLANQFAAQIGVSERYAREDHVHPGTGGGGGEGTPGTSTALVYAYKRAVSPPLDNPGDITYNFVVATIVIPNTNALANGWTKTIPEGTDPLYVVAASAASTATTDNIAANEWATPVKLVENGSDGTNGLNVATIYIYQRSTVNTAPALPTTSLTWQFNPPSLTGTLGSWSTTIPSESAGEFLFVSTATAVSTTATDVIGPSEWSAVRLMARNGLQGPPGAGGTGAPGQRGSITVYQGGQSSWSDSVAHSAILAAGLGGPYNRDTVTLYGTGFSQTRFYDYGSWLILTAVIDGNLLVTGTVSASKISGGILDGIQLRAGYGSTPNGRAFEVSSTGILFCDNIRGGTLAGDNETLPSAPGVLGRSTTGAQNGVYGIVGASNSSGAAHGVCGSNQFNGTSGLVGAANNFDFYANGSGTNYGPFTGAHDALVRKAEAVDIGDILVDVFCVCRGRGVSNTIFETTVSTSPNQKGAIGVVAVYPSVIVSPPAAFTIGYRANWEPVIDPSYNAAALTYNRTAVNSVGEGMINVVGEGGDIQAGDLIVTSSTTGKGMKQSDNIVRSITVARAREACSFEGTGFKQIACIYLCG